MKNEVAKLDSNREDNTFLHLNGIIFNKEEVISIVKNDESYNRELIVDLKNGKTRYVKYDSNNKLNLDFNLAIKSMSFSPLFENYECIKSALFRCDELIKNLANLQNQLTNEFYEKISEIENLMKIFSKESIGRNNMMKKCSKQVEKIVKISSVSKKL